MTGKEWYIVILVFILGFTIGLVIGAVLFVSSRQKYCPECGRLYKKSSVYCEYDGTLLKERSIKWT